MLCATIRNCNGSGMSCIEIITNTNTTNTNTTNTNTNTTNRTTNKDLTNDTAITTYMVIYDHEIVSIHNTETEAKNVLNKNERF